MSKLENTRKLFHKYFDDFFKELITPLQLYDHYFNGNCATPLFGLAFANYIKDRCGQKVSAKVLTEIYDSLAPADELDA